MDAKDHGDHASDKNNICSLEWIAWAIEAARRHKEGESPRPIAAQQGDWFDSDDE